MMPHVPDYQSPQHAPPKRWRKWIIVMLVWLVGLPIWALYLWLFGYLLLRLLS
jgi:hypothetical protein